MRAQLIRTETSDHGTFGLFKLNDLCVYSGELPDRNNAPGLSCIPAGLYKCVYTYSPAFKRFLYAVAPVKGRTGIRIHGANFMGDNTKGFKCQLLGCIALARKRVTMNGQKALSLSAMADLYECTQLVTFDLEIRNEYR